MNADRPPAPPSWFDRAIARAARGRPGWWPTLGVLSVVGLLMAGGGAALAGGARAEILFWSLNSIYGVYAVAAYRHVMDRAGRAFDRFRPLLSVDEGEADAIRTALTTMPAGAAAWSLVAGMALGLAAALNDPNLQRFAARSVPGVALIAANLMFSVGVFAVFIVQVVRVLRLVTTLHRSARQPDLFAPVPARAFATVTARAGILIIVAMVYSMITDPTTFTNPVWVVLGTSAMALAVLVFVGPLLDMGRRLRREKAALLADTTARVRRVLGEIAAAVDERRYADIGPLKAALDAFEQDRQTIARISTMPWDSATFNQFVSAFALPLLVYLVTRLLGRLLDL